MLLPPCYVVILHEVISFAHAHHGYIVLKFRRNYNYFIYFSHTSSDSIPTFTSSSIYGSMIIHLFGTTEKLHMKEKTKENQSIHGNAPQSDISSCRITEREHWLEKLEQLTLLSDVFMSVVFSDLKACQHVVRILTGNQGIRLKTVRTQYVVSRAVSHGARLDVLAEDECGTLYHMEVEASDTVDHARRTRFYGAMTDSEVLRKGKTYSALPDRYTFYISKKDIWQGGCTVYKEEKRLLQTDESHDDGAHITYVNTAVDDGSRIAKLMNYFKTADPSDNSEGELSKRVHFLKTEERGRDIMCEIMEQIKEEGKREGKREGRRAGILESNKKTARNLNRMGMSDEAIAQVVEKDVSVVQKWLHTI